jgi:hypothetical protein
LRIERLRELPLRLRYGRQSRDNEVGLSIKDERSLIYIKLFRLPDGEKHYQRAAVEFSVRANPFALADGQLFNASVLRLPSTPPGWEHEAYQIREDDSSGVIHWYRSSSRAALFRYVTDGDVLNDELFAWANQSMSILAPAWDFTDPRPVAGADRPLNNDELTQFRKTIRLAIDSLGLTPEIWSPVTALQAIDDAVARARVESPPITYDDAKASAINLGFLWGQLVCDASGWEWCTPIDGPADAHWIVTPKRSHAINPVQYFLDQLAGDGREVAVTPRSLFSIICTKRLPRATPGTYQRVI